MATDPTAIFTSLASTLGPELLAIGAVAVGASGALLALRKGWRYFSKLISV